MTIMWIWSSLGMLFRFAHDNNIAIPGTDINVDGEQYSFVQKHTKLDYILFDKSSVNDLGFYKIPKEGSLSITSDQLPIFALIDIHCTRHQLFISKVKSPAWNKVTSVELEMFRVCTSSRSEELELREIQSISEIESYVSDLTNILHESANEALPISGFNPFSRPDRTKMLSLFMMTNGQNGVYGWQRAALEACIILLIANTSAPKDVSVTHWT